MWRCTNRATLGTLYYSGRASNDATKAHKIDHLKPVPLVRLQRLTRVSYAERQSLTSPAALCALPVNFGNMLTQQFLKQVLLLSILEYPLRNHCELTRPVVEYIGILIDEGS